VLLAEPIHLPRTQFVKERKEIACLPACLFFRSTDTPEDDNELCRKKRWNENLDNVKCGVWLEWGARAETQVEVAGRLLLYLLSNQVPPNIFSIRS
jgi:hypothetical protein